MAIGNNNKKIKIKQIKLLSTASPGWGQRPFLDYIRPGVIKEILRPLIGYNQPLPGRGHNCQVRPGARDFISVTANSRLSTMFIFPSHTKQFKIDQGSIRSSLRDGLSKYSCRVVEQCWTVTPCPFPHGDLHLVLPGLNLSILDAAAY